MNETTQYFVVLLYSKTLPPYHVTKCLT